MRKARDLPLYVLLSTMCVTANAQAPQVNARLAPDSVAIGDRFTLEVTVDKDLMQVVGFPAFKDGMLNEQIEIVEERDVDTLLRDGRHVVLGKSYVLTTFEEGVHSIGRFPVLYMDKNIVDTLSSADSLVLQVGTFQIDTMTMTIRDLKSVLKEPLRIGEFSGYLLWGWLAAAALALVILWLVKRRKQQGRVESAPDEEPHVAAIKALEALHNQKLWQNNKHKLYYTRLTDILRRYMEGRWGVAAPEMTSDEIIAAAREQGVEDSSLDSLRDILRSADLVKFAKYTPAPEDNEAAYTKSYYFVENTKHNEVIND